MKDYNTSILGGGWAGMILAKKLIEGNDRGIAIIEATNSTEIGGLLRSEMIKGFTFDCGGPHLLFSKDENVLGEINEILKEKSLRRSRSNFVFFKNQYSQYPFENRRYQLPPEKKARLIFSINGCC